MTYRFLKEVFKTAVTTTPTTNVHNHNTNNDTCQANHLALWVARIDRNFPTAGRSFYQNSFIWPDQHDALNTQVKMWNLARNDVYFCPQLFHGERKKGNVHEVVTCAWADLDSCDPRKLLLKPSITWKTSPSRYAAVWIFDRPINAKDASHISKRIAYYHKDDGCDQSGHDITQLLRLPGTRNYKYKGAPEVELLTERFDNMPIYRQTDFDKYPDVPRTDHTIESIESLPEPEDVVYQNLPYLVKMLFQRGQPYNRKSLNGSYDRSNMVIELITVCRREGLTKGQTVSILEQFPPFIGRINDDGVGWIEKAKIFQKVDNEHPHEGASCVAVKCERMSSFDHTKSLVIRFGGKYGNNQ